MAFIVVLAYVILKNIVMLSKEIMSKYRKNQKPIHIYKLTEMFSVDFFGASEILFELAEYLKINPKPEIHIYSDGNQIIHVPRKFYASTCEWKYEEKSDVILIEYFSSFS